MHTIGSDRPVWAIWGIVIEVSVDIYFRYDSKETGWRSLCR